MTLRQWLLLLFLAALWGASYLFIKLALADVSPSGIVFVRTLLAALLLLPVAAAKGALRGLRSALGPLLALAVIQVAGPFLLISLGEREISSSLAGILVATAPIFTAMLALRLDPTERSSGWGLVGVGIGLGGVALLLGIDASGDAGAFVGALLVVLAGAGYAVGGFIVKRGFSGAQPVGVAAAAMAVSALLMLPLAALTAPQTVPGSTAIVALLVLGLAGTGLAFLIFYTLIGQAGPARASLVAYLAPGFAVVYGVAFLDERVSAGTLAGLGLILAGSWLAAGGRLLSRGVEPPSGAVPAPRAREASRTGL